MIKRWWKKLAGKPKRAVPAVMKYRNLAKRVEIKPDESVVVASAADVRNVTGGKIFVTVEAEFERKVKP